MPQRKWLLQDAKNRLSAVVRRAREEGPQVITLCGEEVVVVVDARQYRKLTRKPKSGLVDFFQNSPLAGADLDLIRARDTGRKESL